MYVFISIILIAEFIIAFAIIFGILNLDKKVNQLSETIEKMRPDFLTTLKNIHASSENLLKKVKEFCEFIKIQRERYIINVIKNIAVFFLLIIAKGKSKKILSAVELAISFGDFLACK